MVIEEGKTFFKKESLFRKISQMLFLLRENPQLLAEFFVFVQDVPASYEKSIGDRVHLKIDGTLIEQIVQLLLDNPFLDTSKTQDANLLFFNTLRGFSAFMKRPIKANTI